MKTINKNGYLLKFVKEQTLEICLAAVKTNGSSLKYVKHIFRTPEICAEAVNENPKAKKYFP